jgi:hypothetical protein
MATAIETQFARWIQVRSDRQTKDGVPYVRCNTDIDDGLLLLEENGIPFTKSNRFDTPISNSSGFNDSIFVIQWKGNDINIKFNRHGTTQKSLAPNRIIKVGYEYTSHKELRKDMILGLQNANEVTSASYTSCLNLLTCIETDGPLEITEQMKDLSEKSKITSDFGEIALAYYRLFHQGGVILFPTASNQSDFDFYHNGTRISAKGDKGSSRYLIGDNSEIEEVITSFGTSDLEVMFKHWYNRDLIDMLNTSIALCESLSKFADYNLSGSITETTLARYVNTNTYDDFIEHLIASQDGGTLGIPRKEAEAKVLWDNSDLNPIKFALLTVWARNIVHENSEDFQKIAQKITANNDIIFEYFDYIIEDQEILITNKEITKYSEWGIRYHSNYGSYKNNFPSLVGIK